MPVQRLSQTDPVCVEQYWVCARESRSRDFVHHVGLSSETQLVKYGDEASWTHMAPPFQSGHRKVNLIAWVNLTAEDQECIALFIEQYAEDIKDVNEEDQYIIFPCRSSPTIDHPYDRFSCAGFVLEAYKSIGFHLLDINSVPENDLEYLCRYYSSPSLQDVSFREKLGLIGAGPWPVVLPGYVLNSFTRDDEQIRREPFRVTESCVTYSEDRDFSRSSAGPES